MKRIKKGEFGYIKSQRKIELAKTILMLALCVALYLTGIYSTGSKANYLTLVAVLGCLPMAKFAVIAIVFLKAKGCSDSLFSDIKASDNNPMFYDLYFTTAKNNFQISALTYKKHNLIMISEDDKIDINLAEEHLRQVLKNCGYENITVKIFLDKSKFIERMNELKNLEDDNLDLSVLKDNILSVSI